MARGEEKAARAAKGVRAGARESKVGPRLHGDRNKKAGRETRYSTDNNEWPTTHALFAKGDSRFRGNDKLIAGRTPFVFPPWNGGKDD